MLKAAGLNVLRHTADARYMILGQIDEEMHGGPVLSREDVTLEEPTASGPYVPLAFPVSVTALTSGSYAQHSQMIALTLSSSLQRATSYPRWP